MENVLNDQLKLQFQWCRELRFASMLRNETSFLTSIERYDVLSDESFNLNSPLANKSPNKYTFIVVFFPIKNQGGY